MKILFICKQREASWSLGASYNGSVGLPTRSSGLYNSAKFVSDSLNALDAEFKTKVVDVVDNNCIDKEVSDYKPDVVIIEAFWVVPEKFDVLKKLHPTVDWIVRSHSETPFSSVEGVIINWISGYLARGVKVAHNSKRAIVDTAKWVKSKYPFIDTTKELLYLPNIYTPSIQIAPVYQKVKDTIRIGCFGAIRPFKNQLIQAIAAIEYADSIGKRLEFHINGSRLEMGGNPILSNMQSMFANHPKHELVMHEWYSHEEFLGIVASMDLGLQVSFTETFNIVSADFVSQYVPIVVSSEISWAAGAFQATTTDSTNIFKTIKRAMRMSHFKIHYLNNKGLCKSNKESLEAWRKTF